jgi:hypothetical protein
MSKCSCSAKVATVVGTCFLGGCKSQDVKWFEDKENEFDRGKASNLGKF